MSVAGKEPRHGRISLYIPIEVKHRELYSKTLLALHAAKRGFSVILGRKAELDRLVLRRAPGVYFGLGTSKTFAPFLTDVARRGHMVVVADEEGLVTYSDDMYLDLKVSSDTLRAVDLLFTWGEENSRVIARGRPEAASKLRVTGNPRFDLLKAPYRRIYEADVAEIRERYPNYVLVCTSFGSCNHYIRNLDYVQSLVAKNVLTTPETVEIYRRFQRMKIDAWHAFLEAIPMMARAYPETDFIIRPHPSESAGPYEQLARDHANVHLEAGRSIHPWLMAARAVVHHYCTSAVEAFAARTPSYALRPTRDPSIEKEIPYECSQNCESPQELVDALRGCLSAKRPSAVTTPVSTYSRYVNNIADDLAVELIVEEICRAVESRPELTARDDASDTFVRQAAARIGGAAREAAAKLRPGTQASQRYVLHKFDGLKAAEVEDVLDVFRFDCGHEFTCTALGHNIVRVRIRNSNGAC